VGDRTDQEPGLVGQRLEQLGGEVTLTLREDFPQHGPVPGGDSADLVVLLGSANGVMEPGREDVVGTESAFVRDCLDRGIPVMAICYGAQLAAHALGGTVERSPLSEVGWYYVESHDPSLCPPGPWAQYHYDRFTVPEGARLLGESEAGPQGFAVESDDGVLRLVAWQFHPEVTRRSSRPGSPRTARCGTRASTPTPSSSRPASGRRRPARRRTRWSTSLST
jgi:GMP synthase-like glutamine amidotransferase